MSYSWRDYLALFIWTLGIKTRRPYRGDIYEELALDGTLHFVIRKREDSNGGND